MKQRFFLFLFIVTFSGCVEDFDLNRAEIEPKLVVEGLITNKRGPYYIRLTESHTGHFVIPEYSSNEPPVPVKDAVIIITDNMNQVDTLVPLDFNIKEYTWDIHLGIYKIVYDANHNVIDTIFLTDPVDFTYDRGFYKTRHLKGIPGRTYYLKVITGNKEYVASSFMPTVPNIDSIGYTLDVKVKEQGDACTPLIYFKEPQGERNYYLIQLNDEVSSRTYSNTLWQFSIISDDFLQPYVNGLDISQGQTPRSIEYPVYMRGDSVYVALSSLTKNAFEYYKALIQQFKNDGGAYQPSPGSPPTNMSNGALGYFRASSVSEKRMKIPR